MHKSRTQTDAIRGQIIWLNLLVAERRIRRKVGSRMSRKGSILASSGGSCSGSCLASLSDPSSAIDLPSPLASVLAMERWLSSACCPFQTQQPVTTMPRWDTFLILEQRGLQD